MPSNMSFAKTTQQFRDRTKTVTRRFGWWKLKSDTLLNGVEKSMGFKKGERINRLGVIKVINTRSERLDAITPRDVIREGFPDWKPADFIEMICSEFGKQPSDIVNRIQFDYVDVERNHEILVLFKRAWDMAQARVETHPIIHRENFAATCSRWILGTSEEFPNVITQHLNEEQLAWLYDNLSQHA